MSAPTASVVIITYERPDFVARCIEHLSVQTRAPLEIVVVDSSSDDETERLGTRPVPHGHLRGVLGGHGRHGHGPQPRLSPDLRRDPRLHRRRRLCRTRMAGAPPAVLRRPDGRGGRWSPDPSSARGARRGSRRHRPAPTRRHHHREFRRRSGRAGARRPSPGGQHVVPALGPRPDRRDTRRLRRDLRPRGDRPLPPGGPCRVPPRLHARRGRRASRRAVRQGPAVRPALCLLGPEEPPHRAHPQLRAHRAHRPALPVDLDRRCRVLHRRADVDGQAARHGPRPRRGAPCRRAGPSSGPGWSWRRRSRGSGPGCGWPVPTAGPAASAAEQADRKEDSGLAPTGSPTAPTGRRLRSRPPCGPA